MVNIYIYFLQAFKILFCWKLLGCRNNKLLSVRIWEKYYTYMLNCNERKVFLWKKMRKLSFEFHIPVIETPEMTIYKKLHYMCKKKKKLRSLTLQFFCITCACSWSLMINIIVIIEIITNYNKNIIFYRI